MSVSAKNRGRLWARWGLDPLLGAVNGLLLEWRAGKFTGVECAARPPADLKRDEIFDEHLVTPGLLNAHCHLDYSFLKGALPRGVGFVPWLRGMIAARKQMDGADHEEIMRAVKAALEDCRGEGTTEIWDIDSLHWGRQALNESGLNRVGYEEFLVPRMKGWRTRWTEWAMKPLQVEGLSPHSTYTVVPRALSDLSRAAKKHRWPVAIHLAESPEERELLVEGCGTLRDLFVELFDYDPVQVLGKGRSPIARAERAGLVGPRALAVHCNLQEPGEIEQLAAARAVVVFCPCSHEFFGYPEYPLAAMRKAGVRLALGTDSLASNDQLSIRAEARSVLRREAGKPIPPKELLGMMTGASLGDEPPYGGRGKLVRDCGAEWAVWKIGGKDKSGEMELLEALLNEKTKCAASSAGWTGGIHE